MRDFAKDWCDRYKHNTCTQEHLRRLQNIGRLTSEEVDIILKSKEANK